MDLGGKMTEKKHFITIVWGTEREETKTYRFNTYAEADAFYNGVEQSNGWWEYDIIASGEET